MVTIEMIREAVDKELNKPGGVIEQLQLVEKAFANYESALDMYAQDPHRFSSRPCATCRAISVLIGKKWGCSKEVL